MKNPARSYHAPDRMLGDTESALPADGIDDLAQFGVRIGGLVHHARQFRHVTLPNGWTGYGQEYGVWEGVRDEHERLRAMVSVTMVVTRAEGMLGHLEARTSVITLDNYLWDLAVCGGHLILDDTWATPSAVRRALQPKVAEQQRLVTYLDRKFGDSEAATSRQRLDAMQNMLATAS